VTVPVAPANAYFGALQVVLDAPLDEADVRLLERSAMTVTLVASVARAERRTAEVFLRAGRRTKYPYPSPSTPIPCPIHAKPGILTRRTPIRHRRETKATFPAFPPRR
jgi:hypothetical protein